SETITSNSPASRRATICPGGRLRESRAAMRMFGSRTARTQRRRRVLCCASTASARASFSARSLRCQSRSRRSKPSSRRSGSSIPSLRHLLHLLDRLAPLAKCDVAVDDRGHVDIGEEEERVLKHDPVQLSGVVDVEDSEASAPEEELEDLH